MAQSILSPSCTLAESLLPKLVTVHRYFERIKQRTQCQNAHFQLEELQHTQDGISIFFSSKTRNLSDNNPVGKLEDKI